MLGCGNVTEVKSTRLPEGEGSAPQAVMRRAGDLAADYAAGTACRPGPTTRSALIADPTVESAVYVATPPGAHGGLALQRCARARKPAYVEKPMARNHAECLA